MGLCKSKENSEIEYFINKFRFRSEEILYCFLGNNRKDMFNKVFEDIPITEDVIFLLLHTISHLIFAYQFNLLLGKGSTDRFARILFKSMINKNEIITFEDFLRTMDVLINGDIIEKLNWTFDLYDVDKDGIISKDDLINIISAIFNISNDIFCVDNSENIWIDYSLSLMSKIDRTGNGYITRSDFLTVSQKDEWVMEALSANIPK